ncbi:hypothetical protein AB0N14_19075 [Streptomyces sp. NPDC051104]|uniref:hypothetical protein n=1 Tax=Streptomyces sp. NPDC051104 TaxID=3155044 RepID=UPI003419D84E
MPGGRSSRFRPGDHRGDLVAVSRGLPTAAQVEAFLAAGFTETDILQVLLAASVKTISNYTNHLFHTPVDKVFARRTWAD